VDVDALAEDVLKNTIIGSGCSSPIVLRPQAVHRDYQMKVRYVSPREGNWADGARHHLYLHIQLRHFREQDIELAIPYQRLTTYNREVQRPEASNQPENPFHQRLTPVIVKLDERARTSQMFGLVSVTARTF
jgi:hypothetical protein